MNHLARLVSVIALSIAASHHAAADELWLGAYKHDIAPFTHEYESGADIKAGWRGNPLDGLRAIGSPSPYAFGSASLDGGTNYAAAGLGWHWGSIVYVRPGIGLAVHDGPPFAVRNGRRTDLGSRVLFEPELAIGWRASDSFSIELSWVHLSHAKLFSSQNPGLNSVGLRAVYRLP